MRKIQYKLIGVLVLFSVFLITLNALVLSSSTKTGFQRYLDQQRKARIDRVIPELQTLYQDTEAWGRLMSNPRQWKRLVRTINRSDHGSFPPSRADDLKGRAIHPAHSPREHAPPRLPNRAFGRVFLFDVNKQLVHGPAKLMQQQEQLTFIPVPAIEGQLIAHLAYIQTERRLGALDRLFLKRQTMSSLLTLLLSLVLSVVLAYGLSKRLLSPIFSVSKVLNAMSKRDYTQRVNVHSNDELGALAVDVNYLASALADQSEQQQRWTTDMAHELRTPLAVLKAQLEALEDGVRAFDDEQLALLIQQTQHLQTLVHDMQHLSASDLGSLTYTWASFDVTQFLTDNIPLWEQRLQQFGIAFEGNVADHSVFVRGDESKITQLMHNLLQNSVRYTQSPGQVELRCHETADAIEIQWQDSAPGVSQEDLPKLFDRLFKADASRQAERGGSGIGLAICRNIVEAHQGHIRAEQASLGGVLIRITLPKSPIQPIIKK